MVGTTILSSADMANPVLALTNDSPGVPAGVVVYEGLNDDGLASAEGLTISDRLAHTNLRYRYFDGTTWSDEQSLTDEPLMDANASVSFNNNGEGLATWEHNTSATPIGADGNYSSETQEIQAAIWDSATHTWTAPLEITTDDGISNSKPQAIVERFGPLHVVWIRDNGDGTNRLMVSTYDSGTGTWSAPAELPTVGLPAGGSFGSLAIGRDGANRVDTIFSYRVQQPDGSVDSRLYNRPSVNFLNPSSIEQIDQDGNYSHLRVTNAPNRSLVAYWQQGDGTTNGVYASMLNRTVDIRTIPWTKPERLSTTTDLTQVPSVAIDMDWTFQSLFFQSTPDGGTAADPSTGPQVGVVLADGVGSTSMTASPSLDFSNGLHFAYQDTATSGGTATGEATIVNDGMATTDITLNWYAGTPDAGGASGHAQHHAERGEQLRSFRRLPGVRRRDHVLA